MRSGSLAAVALLDAGAEALAAKALELALAGDPVAVRFCLGRVVGARRGQPVALDLPPVAAAVDLGGAVAAIVRALAAGRITPGEALTLSQMLGGFPRVLAAGAAAPDPVADAKDARAELTRLLDRLAAKAAPGVY